LLPLRFALFFFCASLAAITYDHPVIYHVFDINTRTPVVRTFFQYKLAPLMNAHGPGVDRSVLVLDNANYHGDDARAPLLAVGVQVAPLPAYSPDFNPIEKVFQVFKTWLRGPGRDLYYSHVKNGLMTREEVLQQGLDSISVRTINRIIDSVELHP
jgi:hypothetical protein